MDAGALNKLKLEVSEELRLGRVPKNIELMAAGEQYRNVFITKPVRTASGVAPVAIMTKPFSCPAQAQCTFCPGGPGSVYGDTPKSYPGGSPAHLRAMRNGYDSYLQVFNRLEHYALLGQDFSKVELILMGGTFTSYPKAYRDSFVTGAFQAMNDFSDLFLDHGDVVWEDFLPFFGLPGGLHDQNRIGNVQQTLLAMKRKTTLEQEQRRNEGSGVRCVVMCIETRSDCSRSVHVDDILRLGGTRVEVGVQTIYDSVLKRIRRGNDNGDNILATQVLKDSFLKVGYHMMIGLPETTGKMDVAMFRTLFHDDDYKPDALKIYPCMVFLGTPLYDEWREGRFEPLTAREAAEIIVKAKQLIPRYCRVMRIQRDIPTFLVEAGVERTNLRQEVHALMKKRGLRCSCIRCREPGMRNVQWEHVALQRMDYTASGGKEVFLSFDDLSQDLLLGFVRLRIPFQPYRREIDEQSAGVREIHVYGKAVGVGKNGEGVQHRGMGAQLMHEAERIAHEEFGRRKMVVIAGIGVKEWFVKKMGYQKDGAYVSKRL